MIEFGIIFVYCARMCKVHVCETFVSIQGESSYAGLPCFFIRLSGCNLRCAYCDTRFAYDPGVEVDVNDLVQACLSANLPLVEMTGGEPLQQSAAAGLLERLKEKTGKTVLVETNGSMDISVVPPGVIVVMDVKCPSSEEEGSFDIGNIDRLRSYDEVKFVISGEEDYIWAKNFVNKHDLTSRCHAVLFSPVWGCVDTGNIGSWIVRDMLQVRMQVQLHKLLGVR